MKRTLIFCDCIEGHNIEYLYHLYCGALKCSHEQFIFVMPESFNDISTELIWTETDNIRFDFFTVNENRNHKSLLINSFKRTKTLYAFIEKIKPTHIFLISLMSFIPFIAFVNTHGAKMSGIIYNIYLYRWKNSKFLLRFIDVCKFYLMTKRSLFSKLFILNDNVSARYLNMIYKTDKFHFLPDPVNMFDSHLSCESLRDEFHISFNKTVYLHLGNMADRKGTLLILESLRLIQNDFLSQLCIIFAGQIDKNIIGSFYELVNTIKDRIQIIVINNFISYELINRLCITSDYILMPYKHANQSSGLLGYAVFFKKAVIGPDNGLIGRLIRKYKLGITLTKITPFFIAKAIRETSKREYIIPQNNYLETNSPDAFSTAIFK
jgi:glycosyltransferase involved in cell wall biosynthesis